MPALKDHLSPALVTTIAGEFAEVCPRFDRVEFERLALEGLDTLELKARVSHIAYALVATLPSEAPQADRVIRSVLACGGVQGWASLPVCEFVAVTMLDHPDIGLALLAALTPRFSAELAIRPFIESHPDRTMATLETWVEDPDEHVRRLVSEGTRPRLPWAPVLRQFVADPTPTVALLDRLHDDPSDYVRRSVANHLNDISKDHPDLAITTATRWRTVSTHGDWVARHALRTLIKRGHPAALEALDYRASAPVEVTALVCTPTRISIGESVTISCTLVAAENTPAVIDYRIHYQGTNSTKAPKVFKWTTRHLAALEPITLTRQHSFGHVSIRRIHPGAHRIDIQINGHVLATTEIDVTTTT